MRKLNNLHRKGQGPVEEALILVLIAIVVIGILTLLGRAVFVAAQTRPPQPTRPPNSPERKPWPGCCWLRMPCQTTH